MAMYTRNDLISNKEEYRGDFFRTMRTNYCDKFLHDSLFTKCPLIYYENGNLKPYYGIISSDLK